MHKEKIEMRFKGFFRKYDRDSLSHYIPCLYKPCPAGSTVVLIYFHANAEDAVRANELVENLMRFLRVHVIAVEYPGYGLF